MYFFQDCHEWNNNYFIFSPHQPTTIMPCPTWHLPETGLIFNYERQQIPKFKFLQIRSRLPRTHFSGDGLRRIFFRSLGAAIFHESDPSATEPCKCKRIIALRLYSLFGPNLSDIDPLSSVVAVVITLGHKRPREEMLIILSLSLLDGGARHWHRRWLKTVGS